MAPELEFIITERHGISEKRKLGDHIISAHRKQQEQAESEVML